jgi:hypothetical protein
MSISTALPSSADAFEFLAISDLQGMTKAMYDAAQPAMSAILNHDTLSKYNFIVNGGDMGDNGKSFYQWQWSLNGFAKAFANTSTFFGAGNHEDGSFAMKNFYNYTLPSGFEQTGETGQYYSFNYANAHIAVLDTNDATSKGLSNTQMNWLTNDLGASKADWKIVLMHKSIYSAGSHSKDSDIVSMRAQLAPLFAEMGVDLVLAGHDHTYTVTNVIGRDGNPAVDEKGNPIVLAEGKNADSSYGTVYITLGTMGTKFYDYKEPTTAEMTAMQEELATLKASLAERSAALASADEGGKAAIEGAIAALEEEIAELEEEIAGAMTRFFNAEQGIEGNLSGQTFGYISAKGGVLTYTGYVYSAGAINKISTFSMSRGRYDFIRLAEANSGLKTVETSFFNVKLDESTYDLSALSEDAEVYFLLDNGRRFASIDKIMFITPSAEVSVYVVGDDKVDRFVQSFTIVKTDYIVGVAVTLGIVVAVIVLIVSLILILRKWYKKKKGTLKELEYRFSD